MTIQGLRGRRMEAVMTQEELARRAGVAEATVVAAEKGKPVRISTIRKLAGALGVRPQELVRIDGDPGTEDPG